MKTRFRSTSFPLTRLPAFSPLACSLLAALLFCQGCTGGGDGSLGTSSSGSNGGGVNDGAGDGSGTETGNGGSGAGGNTGGGTSGGGDVPGGTVAGSGGGAANGGGGGASTVAVSVKPSASKDEQPFAATVQEDGTFNIVVATSGTTAFQVVSTLAESQLAGLALTAPDGTVVVSSDDSPLKTLSASFIKEVNAFPYPTRGSDPAVQNGNYTLRVATLSAAGSTVSGRVVAKADTSLTSGVLRVNLFYVGNEAKKEATKRAIQQAFSILENSYAAAGITVRLVELEVNSDTGIIPNPFEGSEFYTVQGNQAGVQQYALNIYVGEFISSTSLTTPGNELDGVLGVSAGIPGAAVPTSHSAVAVSLSEHSGIDGTLDDDEIRVLGETFAHESGHYLGLFHPVETAGVNFSGEDPLADTQSCTTETDCIAKGTAANLMFPRPVNGVATQQALTTDQAAVINLQALID